MGLIRCRPYRGSQAAAKRRITASRSARAPACRRLSRRRPAATTGSKGRPNARERGGCETARAAGIARPHRRRFCEGGGTPPAQPARRQRSALRDAVPATLVAESSPGLRAVNLCDLGVVHGSEVFVDSASMVHLRSGVVPSGSQDCRSVNWTLPASYRRLVTFQMRKAQSGGGLNVRT